MLCRADLFHSTAVCTFKDIATNHDELIGQRTGSYEIVHLIGNGAMGRVYRAREVVRGGACAVKVLSGDAARDASLRQRFRREAGAMSRIEHPNVVALLDFIDEPDRVHLVMELVSGETLSKLMTRKHRFDPRRAALIIRQVASGLGAIHDAEFVHRDLKPSNIMVSVGEDGSESAKIVDLGMVGLGPGSGGKRITEKGFTVGTAKYMAPEQMIDACVSHLADLYSLGMIAQEMVHGRGLERIIARLIDPVAAQRPPTAEAVVSEIDRILESLPVVAPVDAEDPSEADTVDIEEPPTISERPVSTRRSGFDR